MGEFELIERLRARAGRRDDVVLGIGDDAALLAPSPGELLALCCDTLNADVHFPLDTAADALGWKALAVNLSDLAAIGAEPRWALLALSLPEPDAAWLDRFLDGWSELAATHGVALVGGDTTRGPLSVTVTIAGSVPAALALRRHAARVGDEVWVTGTLGDAAAALALAAPDPALRARLDRPTPRVAAGMALRGLAHACIDVSDGLLADLGHVLEASGVGARIELAALPCSGALSAASEGEPRWQFQAAGGDDYELCFTAPPDRREAIRAALAATATPAGVIGRIEAGNALHAITPDGRRWQPPHPGYEHFRGGRG